MTERVTQPQSPPAPDHARVVDLADLVRIVPVDEEEFVVEWQIEPSSSAERREPSLV